MENTMVYDIIEEISSIGSTKSKEKILKKHKNNGILKDAFRLAYSRSINFHIRKFPDFDAKEESKTLVDGFKFLEEILAQRIITGHAAIAGLTRMLECMSAKDVEIMRRVINRDLECGVGRSIPNRVWDNLLPEQPQCLAQPYSEKNLKRIKFPAIAQLKADGARCFAEVVEGEVTFLSRAGNEYQNLKSLEKEILEITKGLGDVVIDGELVYFPTKTKSGLDSLFDDEDEKTETVASRELGNGIANKSLQGTISDDEAEGIRFQVWDLIPYDVVYSKGALKSKGYQERFNDLAEITKNSVKLEIIPSFIVNNIEEAKKIYKNYIAQGLEGIILKNIDGLWVDSRSFDLVKFKEEIDFDLEVVDVYCHSKDPKKVGGVTLRSTDGKILVNCGSGFKDKDYEKLDVETKVFIPFENRDDLDRGRLWNMHETTGIIGMILSGVCNGALKVKGRDTYSLFLPRVKSIRLDKEKANTFDEIFGVTDDEYFNK